MSRYKVILVPEGNVRTHSPRGVLTEYITVSQDVMFRVVGETAENGRLRMSRLLYDTIEVVEPQKGIIPYDLPLPPRRSPDGTSDDPVFPPGLGLFPSSPDGPYFAPFRKGGITPPRGAIEAAYPESGPFGECYQTPTGMMVHVRPGCRCKA